MNNFNLFSLTLVDFLYLTEGKKDWKADKFCLWFFESKFVGTEKKINSLTDIFHLNLDQKHDTFTNGIPSPPAGNQHNLPSRFIALSQGNLASLFKNDSFSSIETVLHMRIFSWFPSFKGLDQVLRHWIDVWMKSVYVIV